VSEDPRSLQVASLTTYGMAADGTQIEMNGKDPTGEPVKVLLPTACVTQLLMTLPAMLEDALQRRSGDDSKRVVYSLDHWRMERGERAPNGTQLFILTVGTEGGFRVSFAAPADTLVDIADSIFGGVAHEEPAHQPRPRLS
jgi:hypothetical protein